MVLVLLETNSLMEKEAAFQLLDLKIYSREKAPELFFLSLETS